MSACWSWLYSVSNSPSSLDWVLMSCTVNIPIITVFTKFDLLVNQFLMKDKSKTPMPLKLANSERKASESLDSSGKKLQDIWKSLQSTNLPIAWVKMSISTKNTDSKLIREMLISLTNVTREKLRDVEGELWIPWVTAQQVNARQKVMLSIQYVPIIFTFQNWSWSSLISEGLKSNQVSLHVFKMKCSWSWYRVLAKARAKHRVWGPNNNKLHSSHPRRCFKGLELQGSSQSKLLHFLSISSVVVDASIRFCRALSFSLKCSASLCRSYLTRPHAWPSDGTDYIFDRVICRSSDGGVSTVSGLISIIQAAGATALALPLSAIGLGAIAIKFLYGKYQQ